jgi:hypothetical protein
LGHRPPPEKQSPKEEDRFITLSAAASRTRGSPRCNYRDNHNGQSSEFCLLGRPVAGALGIALAGSDKGGNDVAHTLGVKESNASSRYLRALKRPKHELDDPRLGVFPFLMPITMPARAQQSSRRLAIDEWSVEFLETVSYYCGI